jgi:phage terminase large subunit GpA-like protein
MDILTTSPEAEATLQQKLAHLWTAWGPPPDLRVSEWAEKNRELPKGSSARPGPWVTESYQREIMDCLLDPEVLRVICRKSTQLGWSEILNNIVGYFIDAEAKPIMLVQPTEGNAKAYSKKRIAPMIDSCPALKLKVREATSRRAGNTMQLKEFDGGFLKIAGANSAANLRSDPIAILLLDEVEGYPLDVDGEGNPVDIAEHRTETFDDSKILIGSTPAKPKGISVIDAEYEASSQGLYYVPCPHCGFEQPLFWRDPDTKEYRLVWDKDHRGEPITSTVRYMCAGCKQGIDEKYKGRMLAGGRWVHKYPDRKSVRGFHLNALYSPWKPIWATLAKKWIKAQDNPEKLKAFVNLSLGETWDEGAEQFDAKALTARREAYPCAVPRNAGMLVAAVDVQHNRLEAQVLAFGAGEETWLIDHEVFWGDPGVETEDVNVWRQLDEFLLSPYKHESGVMLSPSIVLIDSGDGGHTDAVYDYVLPRQHTRRRIFACKGVDFLSRPGLAQEGSTKRAHIRLWNIATYAAKDRVMARMKIPKPGSPGYMHFPEWVTEEYFAQLTGEKKITVVDKRTRTRKAVYVKTHTRNEALDLTVYCHAGLFVLQNYCDPLYFRDLAKIVKDAQAGVAPGTAPVKGRRVRSSGIS